MHEEALAVVPTIPEDVVECFCRIAEKCIELARAIAEALRPIIKAMGEIFRQIWEAIAREIVPKKWWYLYKHAKRRRVRKKYEKRIRESVLAFLAGGP